MSISTRTPLIYDESIGPYSAATTLKEVVYQYLKTLALTSPGERRWNKKFGIGLKHRLFERDSASLRSSIAASIREQIALYVPFARVVDIQFSSAESDGGYLSISLSYVIVTGASISDLQQVGWRSKADGTVETDGNSDSTNSDNTDASNSYDGDSSI
jgi:phage baseplate assembly protein W